LNDLPLAVQATQWCPCWRIIPAARPSSKLLHRVASRADMDLVEEIESLTAPRGSAENTHPPVTTANEMILHGFRQVDPNGSRFSDGSYGVFYTAKELLTAVAETRYHRDKFLRATRQPPGHISMQVLSIDLIGKLHSLVGCRDSHPELYHPEDYGQSQLFAKRLWEQGSEGIIYHSVRRREGFCAAVFYSQVLLQCHRERLLTYKWNGQCIESIAETELFIHEKQTVIPFSLEDD